MQKLTATFRIVTPMFIAGADQNKAELRAPSIKGALRFWWRALNWAQIRQASADDQTALKKLKEDEGQLFGDADSQGQGNALIKLDNILSGALSGNTLLASDASRKYLGYGLFSMGDHQERKAIAERKSFDVSILIHKDTNTEAHAQFEKCVKAFGLLGGLGSRSRNGFGSIAISSYDDQNLKFNSLDSYKNTLSSLITEGRSDTDTPPFTAISRHTKILYGPLKDSQELAHRFIGNLYKSLRTSHQHESRKRYFGLPLDGYDTNNRRSSPLLFHIHPVENRFVPVVMYVPAAFHPGYPQEDYSLVESFLESFKEESK